MFYVNWGRGRGYAGNIPFWCSVLLSLRALSSFLELQIPINIKYKNITMLKKEINYDFYELILAIINIQNLDKSKAAFWILYKV